MLKIFLYSRVFLKPLFVYSEPRLISLFSDKRQLEKASALSRVMWVLDLGIRVFTFEVQSPHVLRFPVEYDTGTGGCKKQYIFVHGCILF